MDPTHPYFPDGLNMLNDDFDLSGPAETVAGPSGSGATPTSRTKSKRLTSDAWQCFDVVEMTLLDGTVGPRAKCKFCPKNYTTTKGGTGHLRRHMLKCMPKHVHVPNTTQTQLQRHPDGSVMTWYYGAAHARECLARYIAQTDQPINFGNCVFFQEFITSAFCPQMQIVSRTTTRNDLIKMFKTQRDDLTAELQHLTVSIALTSDIWNACSKQDYLCVTGHYLDSECRIQKKILGFRPMDFAHTADNIFAVILSVLETYGITHRILSITLDNASANTKSIALFTERNIPQAGGYFFHQRCACHIINLVVQSGLKEVSNRIERIRDAISWIGSSNPRFQEFGRHCTLNGLQPRRFQTDMPVRWNSTYLMLKNCLEYDTTISGFYNMKLAESGCPPAQSLTPDDWYVAKIFVEFLQVFYNATVTLSRVYYPTSSQAIHQIVEMSDMLNTYREDDLLGDAVVAMETKFKKYWSEMPFLYALGVIVDPRIKLAGLEYLLEFTGNKLSIDYSEQITDIRNKLFEVFSIYERRFGVIHTEPSPEPDTQPLPTSWSILKRRKKDKLASSSSSTTRSAASSGAELNRFLEAQFDADENTENFDLLLWWKTYSYRYPVLSHLARDILVIPVSTVSSEQAFSTSGRIIEPRRNCLTPEMVEVLICIRDWGHARKRMQNETVDEQFIQNFSNLYVDEGSGSNQVQN
ncbi:hypothetical protein Dsin_019495 [Dipteronia sinensis]|uniref:BED-type domain-containing protein n=1 Tax=Dipteronia sinensis TaxID=43782 RepID=A0AAE0A819_9ROSI|nr:hypothetical protein Dsin_019495 [Dipteronia sinensis]